ncbi:MAG: DUF4148 domain-containing protein [Rubrivivax sp.]
MARKQLIALAVFATFAAAGTAARADDITMVDDSKFMSTKTRADVQAEVLMARAAGTLGVSEVDLTPTMTAKKGSALSREQVRAEVGDSARKAILQWYPA